MGQSSTKRKMISFGSGNEDMYDEVIKQANSSGFVCDAIRFYLKHKDDIGKQEGISEERVKELIADALRYTNIVKEECSDSIDEVAQDTAEKITRDIALSDDFSLIDDAMSNFEDTFDSVY